MATDYSSRYAGAQIDEAVGRALGFGLGTTAKRLTSADNLDDIYQNGFYGWLDSVPQNAIRTYCAMRVENDSYSKHVLQTCVVWGDGIYSVVRRMKTETGWTPWEYFNPPMQPGVEYRTTERYMGKPVYAKLVNFGALPNAAIKSVVFDTTGTISYIVSAFGFCKSAGSTFPTSHFGGLANENVIDMTVRGTTDGWTISIYASSDRSSLTGSYVLIKYIKSTD